MNDFEDKTPTHIDAIYRIFMYYLLSKNFKIEFQKTSRYKNQVKMNHSRKETTQTINRLESKKFENSASSSDSFLKITSKVILVIVSGNLKVKIWRI